MDEPTDRILITFVLCSRNDGFQGDSLWRLGTSLNYLARQLDSMGRLDSAEVIVADWGSTEPLRDATVLTTEARSLVRFLTVPPDLAAEKQQDSPFAEVIAINAAVRRARGDHIGRIDQDTLVGARFLRWFFDAVENPSRGVSIDSTVMVSNRRRVPYHFAVATPRFPVVERYVDTFGTRLLPRMIQPAKDRYWQCYIGILLFHRKLWEDCEGYDESFLYYGYMEFDLFLRLRMRYDGMDLGPVVGCDFFHLDHVPAWRVRVKQARRENGVVRSVDDPPELLAPNGPGWGLAGYDIPLEPSPGTAALTPEQSRWSPGDRVPLVALTATSTVRTLGRFGYDYALAAIERVRPRSRRSTTSG